jgi:Transposase DDE domain
MQYTLTRAHVHKLTSDLLIENLELRDYKRTCSAPVLVSIIFAACARLVSISAAAADFYGGPSVETVRKATHFNTPKIEILERRLNRALRATRPKKLRACQQVAIDLTLIPYHGQHQTKENELYRSQAKSGTTHFHAYASAYLIRHGQRLTLALSYVRQGEDLAVVLKRLMGMVRKTGVRPSLVLLDRGFFSVSVIRYFQRARIPFLMPVPLRGRKKEHPDGPGGTRVFEYWSKSGRGQHTLTSTPKKTTGTKKKTTGTKNTTTDAKNTTAGTPKKTGAKQKTTGAKKITATVGIVVHCRNRAGRRKKQGRERLVYAYWGWDPPAAAQVSELYRRRFGIETSYRQMNQCRARTCTRSPAVRLLLVGVALVLRNVWVWLHWSVLSAPRRGQRLLRLAALRVKRLLLMLLAVAIEMFGVVDGIDTQRPIPARLRR